MYFAWFIKDYLSKVPDTLMGAILKGVKTLVFSLDTWIYGLIIDLYNMFSSLCTVRLLSNDLLQELSQRIGYVLGVVMLFYVVLSFIQMLLNPDVIMDKEKGAVSIIKKTIIVIVMLGSANFVFNTLYQVQNMVVKSNVISKLLLPYTITTSINNQESDNNDGSIVDDAKFGSLLSEELLMSFYQLEQFDSIDDMGESDASTYTACQATVNSFRSQIINYKRFDLGYNCLNEDVTVKFQVDSGASSDDQETSIVNFNWLLSPICGLAVAYLIFMYCLKVGVRMVQLMFLEIISPMAFVSYLAPKKDTMFSKWQGIYVSTYIDVFVRIAVINFVFFLIATIFSTTENSGLEFQGANLANNSFFKVVIILSLLTFAKRAPELISELLPKSKSKLGFGASMKDIVGLNRGVGTIAGAATGAAIGFLGGEGIGMFGGALRGARSGFGAKSVNAAISGARKSQSDVNKKVAEKRANGASWLGSHFASSSPYERDEREIARAQEKIDMYKNANSEAESESVKNGSNYLMYSSTMRRHVSLNELDKLRNDQNLSASERSSYENEYNQLKKSATMFNLDYGRAAENGKIYFDSNGDLSSITGKSGTEYNSVDAISDISDVFGGRNATIDVNMTNLVGVAAAGRGNAGKSIRNENSTFITEKKGSSSYKREKANAGK